MRNNQLNYIIEENLQSSNKDRTISAIGAMVVMSIFLLLLSFLSITLPDPPLPEKKGVVELDFGVVDGGYGQPDQGGPSTTPPAIGGETGGSTQTTQTRTPPPASVIHSTKGAQVKGLPKITTAKSTGTTTSTTTTTTTTTDSRLSKIKNRNTGNGNASQDGNPNGWRDGKGSSGTGDGPNSGIQGNGGRNPGAAGKGNINAPFVNFTVRARTVKITADGRGTIRYRLRVDCNGNWSFVGSHLSGTYNGRATEENLKSVFSQAMGGVTFVKNGDNCPEEKIVSANIQPE